FHEAGGHQVRAVAGAGDPAVHHRVDARIAGGDVLAQAAPRVAGGRDAVGEGATVGAGVREIVLPRHLLGVTLGGDGELVVPSQRRSGGEHSFRAAVGAAGTDLVDAREHAGAEVGKVAG